MGQWAYCGHCSLGINRDTPTTDEILSGRMECRGCGNTIDTPVSLLDLLTDTLDRLSAVEKELKTLKEDKDDEL